MKTINIKYISLKLIFVFLLVLSCGEKEWLEEEAFDFYTPGNSYTTPEQIDFAVVELYKNVRETILLDPTNTVNHNIFNYVTDVGYDCISPTHELNNWSDRITPDAPQVLWMWKKFYKIVYNANVVISRIEAVEYPSVQEKSAKIAEVKFFRAFAYKALATIFGGVPLVLEETSSPKRDYVRSSREEIWNQVISDLTDAAANLPNAGDAADGRMTKGAANHLLAEMYIITNDLDKAISTATEVIDNSGYALMTNRFGTRADEPGDVYWDLFRIGNQNRGSGNTEGIWVDQYEWNVVGGGRSDLLPRWLAPFYIRLTDTDGVSLFTGPNENYAGRGIGWWAATDYTLNTIWENGSDNDIRNSEQNIMRDIRANNPNSAYNGELIVESGAIANFNDPYGRWWSAIFAKSAPIGNFPEDLVLDKDTGLTTGGANSSFRDRYMIRLAETYLLRAEAYLRNGQPGLAADDINEVRARSNADLITAGDVDIDFILDERARELFIEENRMLTLMRMGIIVERVNLHDPYHNGKYENFNAAAHQNLWPIPNSEIQRNIEATLEQNSGY